MKRRDPRAVLEEVLVHPEADGEDRQKRLYVALLVVIFAPLGVVFAVVSFRAGERAVGWADLGMAVAFSSALLINRSGGDIRALYRLMAVAVVPLSWAVLYLGGGDGYAYLWHFFIPPAVFYVFGAREGLAWFAVTLVGTSVLLLGDVGATYPASAGIRFVISYAITGALALGLQLSRERLFARLTMEKQELQRALDEVTVLSDMIPMCAWCRNVRDDAGYWSRIEEYLSRKAGAVVTHGLCPDCARKLAEEGGAGMPPAQPDPKQGPHLL